MPKLEPFDPSAPLVANTFLRIHGTLYRKGDAVPYSDADDRILNRLYQQRKIGYGKGDKVKSRIPSEEFLSGNAERREQEREAERTAASLSDDVMAEQAEALAKANTKDQLLKLADGLEGVTNKQNKGEIALALVRAGRGVS